jgi:hypothetical protein
MWLRSLRGYLGWASLSQPLAGMPKRRSRSLRRNKSRISISAGLWN